jgi:3-oxoacyl-[acyl-carrier-protein] synthase III
MTSRLAGVRVAGLASAVPSQSITPLETAAIAGLTPEEAQKVEALTGIHRRHIAPAGMCSSDLCAAAADRLLDDLGWERSSVDAIVMVSQTHDYDFPATACCLQERLGLRTECAALDMSLGCSGHVYGLWVTSMMAASGSAKRVLLMVGDTPSWSCSPHDRATAFLFGDAGTVTALEADPAAAPITFVLRTDGAGKNFLIQPGSGYRQRITAEGLERTADPDGVLRNRLDCYMDGQEVFNFALKELPPLVADVLAAAGWNAGDIDSFVPHQANAFMLKYLCKRMKIPLDKLVLSLDEFGNTSSASIPLAVSHRLAPRLREQSTNLVLAGFGVGWSWAAATVTCGPIVAPDVLFLDHP